MKKTGMVFGDDRAKTNPWRDDRLGVAPLAQRLAKVIVSIDAPNGFVIGVNGVWGHGKSTLLNFTCAFLEKYRVEAETEDERIHQIDFRPWMVSGHQDLVAAFFKVLSESLGPRENRFERLWRRIANRFSGSSDAIMDAIAKLAVIADVGVTQGAASGTVSIIKRPLKQKLDEFLKEPSLQSAHSDLVEQLNNSGKQFLVVIDDIDRLTKPEMMSIMQMVKTVGQLPNVVYLLSYDRDKLRLAFDETDSSDGPRYAEKIIQHEIQLPKPPRNALLRMLDSEIKFLTGPAADDMRWWKLISSGIHRWVGKPRDVLLLTNAVKFSWPALDGELDPSDLLLMEGLKLFDPTTFQWVKENRDFLFRQGRFQFLDAAARQPYFERFKESISQRPDHDQILDLLSTLFPTLAELAGNRALNYTEPYFMTATRRGIATEAGYDAFFALSPRSDAIPKRVIDEITSPDVSHEQVVAIISSVLGKTDTTGVPMLLALLEEIRYRFDASPAPALTVSLLNGLFDKSEEVLTEPAPDSMFRANPMVSLLVLVMEMLRAQDRRRADELLLPAFGDCASVTFCAEIYIEAAMALGEMPRDDSRRDGPFISSECLKQIAAILLQKINSARGDGTLVGAALFWGILRAWHHLTERSSEGRDWLSEQMNADSAFTIKIARGVVGRRLSGSTREYIFSGGLDEALYDSTAMNLAVEKHLDSSSLTDDERYLLETLHTGLSKSLSEDAPDVNG